MLLIPRTAAVRMLCAGITLATPIVRPNSLLIHYPSSAVAILSTNHCVTESHRRALILIRNKAQPSLFEVMDTRQENDASAPVVKRRRNPRAVLACERCRSKKYKCSEAQPCSHCKRMLSPGLDRNVIGQSIFVGSGAECNYGRGYRVVNDQASLVR